MRARSDRGQLVPLYALVILLAGGAALLLVHLGTLAVHRAQARTAADAAALAGAAGGRDAADDVARANGAVLESFEARGDEVAVRVRVGTTHATAWARRDGGCGSAAEGHPVHFGPCQSTSPLPTPH
jgi:uncharacterized membrane protein